MKGTRELFYVLLAAGVSMTGCMVGPNYKTPETQVPDSYRHTEPPTTAPAGENGAVPASQPVATSGVEPGTAPDDRWWLVLNDGMLNSIVDRSLESNLDLQAAEQRIREARALRGIASADLWPQIGFGSSYAYSGSSLNASPKVSSPGLGKQLLSSGLGTLSTAIVSPAAAGATLTPLNRAVSVGLRQATAGIQQKLSKVSVARDLNLFQAGFDASWELDVFGGTRRAIEAADRNIQASIESLHDIQTILISEVARNYVEARSFQKRLAIARDNIKSQTDSLELTKVKFEAGLTSELDVAQAAAQLATTTSQLPLLETMYQQSVHRLGVLLGRDPGLLEDELAAATPIPGVPPSVPVGLPSELLRRRPDVRQSEHLLAAATAQIGVAVADLYPRFSINGSLGSRSTDIQNFLDRNSLFWSIGPGFSWPIFQGGRRLANIEVQNARQQQALIDYRSTILIALEEVENSLVAYRQDQSRQQELDAAVRANKRAVEVATERYRKGLTDFLRVLESQRSLYATQDAMVENEAAVIADFIALNKALGGGWQITAETPAQ